MLVDVETTTGSTAQRIIDAKGSSEAENVAKRQASLGISPMKHSEIIGFVAPNSPAEKAGLQAGDQITVMLHQNVTWQEWSKIVRENAGRNLPITYVRNGVSHTSTLRPEPVELPDRSQIVGRVGLAAQADQAWAAQVRHHYTPTLSQAWQLGWEKTHHYAALTLGFFGKLIMGQASLSHISGPLTIADVAGQTVQIGWQPYVEFLALVSISLGVMNLLPVPMLDGGHLVYYTWELIRGKPLSQRAQEWGLRMGATLMLMMMLLAFFNDITRLFLG